MLPKETQIFLRNRFRELVDPVKIIFRKSGKNIDIDIENILKDISSYSEKIIFETDDNLVCYSSPCISLQTLDKDYGIRFMGKPDRGEFKTFIDTIVMISKNDYDLSERTLELVEQINEPVDIKVFITNNCGWCPPAVIKAYSFAMVNENIKATAIDCYIFSDLAVKYNVATVPKIIINNRVEQIGLKDENQLLGSIFASIS